MKPKSCNYFLLVKLIILILVNIEILNISVSSVVGVEFAHFQPHFIAMPHTAGSVVKAGAQGAPRPGVHLRGAVGELLPGTGHCPLPSSMDSPGMPSAGSGSGWVPGAAASPGWACCEAAMKGWGCVLLYWMHPGHHRCWQSSCPWSCLWCDSVLLVSHTDLAVGCFSP